MKIQVGLKYSFQLVNTNGEVQIRSSYLGREKWRNLWPITPDYVILVIFRDIIRGMKDV